MAADCVRLLYGTLSVGFAECETVPPPGTALLLCPVPARRNELGLSSRRGSHSV